jgi:hypothetical protein
MIAPAITSSKRSFLGYLEKFTGAKNWKIKFSLICFGLVLFFSFPPYENFITRNQHDTWEIVLKQIDNPLVQYSQDKPESHNAKRTFRLFVPTVCKVFHVKNIYIIYFLQLTIAIVFFYLVISITYRITDDKISALLVSLAFSFTYVGQVGVLDMFAKFDGIAITCLLAAMYFNRPLLIFLFCSAAAWTDERGLIASSLIFIWWKAQEAENGDFGFRRFVVPERNSMAVIFAGLSYLLLRFYLQNEYDLTTVESGVGLSIFFNQLNMVPFGVWSAFEGLWIMIILALMSLLYKKNYALFFLTAIASLASVGVSFLVLDITRSMIYCLPLFFISIQVLSKTETHDFFRNQALLCLLICVIVPTYFAEGAFRIEGSSPLVFKIIDFLREVIR